VSQFWGSVQVSFAGGTDLVTSRNYQFPAHPAQPGDEILIQATGLGSAANVSTGMLTVTIGGFQAAVESMNAVPGQAGVFAVRMHVPSGASLGDTVPLQIAIATPGGQAVGNVVTVAIEAVRR
jgi:uncharacterized protein (TIGR03437 family)